MQRLVFMLVLSACAFLAAAQGVYKYTDSKGQTVYTDDPTAGKGTAQRIETPSRPSTEAPAKKLALSEAEKELLQGAERRAALLDRTTDDIVIASRTLREAEERRTAGVEPQPGDRTGRRFSSQYVVRQQALEQEVAAARARLSDALERRNALR